MMNRFKLSTFTLRLLSMRTNASAICTHFRRSMSLNLTYAPHNTQLVHTHKQAIITRIYTTASREGSARKFWKIIYRTAVALCFSCAAPLALAQHTLDFIRHHTSLVLFSRIVDLIASPLLHNFYFIFLSLLPLHLNKLDLYLIFLK